MSQTIRILEINGEIYPEIFSYPVIDEAVNYISDAVFDGIISEAEEYFISEEWYEIGDGESETDIFFEDSLLLSWLTEGGEMVMFEKITEFGYNLNHIQTNFLRIDAEDIL